MMRARWLLVGLLGMMLASQVSASDFEATLSKETAQFTVRSDSSIIGWGGADLSLSFFYNEAEDYLLQADLLQMRQASEQNPLTLGVGVKGYLGELDNVNEDVFAFGIGGEIRYTLPGIMPMALYLHGHYAPDITSFGDVEEIIDYRLGFQIEILPQTTAFIGVRHIEIKTEDDGDVELDDDRIHLGVRLTF